jgi:hypothetical protein
MSMPTVWVAKDDGSDIIRADAIAGIGRDYNGNITARLAGARVRPLLSSRPACQKPSTRPLIFTGS